MAEPLDAEPQLAELCRVLNHYGVRYVVFGSQVVRLAGVSIETLDVDVVPEREDENLQRLAEALNLLRPRWRVEGVPGGMRIDGGLQARHFGPASTAVGLETRLGPIDVVLEPEGFENGYTTLQGRATTVRIGDVSVPVGSIADVVRSKELLGREKDREHLRLLRERWAVEQRSDLDLGGGLDL